MNNQVPMAANAFIEQQLDKHLRELENTLESDILTFVGPVEMGVDDVVKNVVEQKPRNYKKWDKLTVFLTTSGGYIEVVHRMVDTLRHHYKTVDFVIPNYAFSAGTVFALSGDSIYMDYYSRLGPIDPQISRPHGEMVPALGYLVQWERLIKKAQDGSITLPEVQLMIQGFDQAELYQYEQAKELSISLLKDWLVSFKFKNWKKTKTRKTTVTQKMKEDRAKEIAEALNDTEKWHMHGYGISMDVLINDLKLVIDDYGKNPKLCDKIKQYNTLLDDYMAKMNQIGVVHKVGNYQPYHSHFE